MHDYHAVSTLVARLTRDPGRAEGIAEVLVRASPVFSPEALRQAYQMLTEDTPLSGSRLLVEELADHRECAQCGTAWTVSPDDVAGHLVICPSCGALAPLDAQATIELLEIRHRPRNGAARSLSPVSNTGRSPIAAAGKPTG